MALGSCLGKKHPPKHVQRHTEHLLVVFYRPDPRGCDHAECFLEMDLLDQVCDLPRHTVETEVAKFFHSGPIAVVPLAVFFIVWPEKVHIESIGKQSWRNFDFVGGFLMLAASTLFVFGLQEAGIGAYPWSSPTIVCTLNYGALCFVALIAWEFYIGQTLGDEVALMMPLRVITDRVMLAGLLYGIVRSVITALADETAGVHSSAGSLCWSASCESVRCSTPCNSG